MARDTLFVHQPCLTNLHIEIWAQWDQNQDNESAYQYQV